MQQPRLTISPRPTGGGWEYQLFEDLECVVAGFTIVVPRFFTYDGATIPAIAWQAFYTPSDPIMMGPALVHDWIYGNHQTTRAEADDILHSLWLENGVRSSTAWVMYLAVSQIGQLYWPNTESDKQYLRELHAKLGGVGQARYRFPLEELARRPP